jgi:uncharacterized protein YdhG (YjbR/CyaY superfamily)
MSPKTIKPKSIGEYIGNYPAKTQKKLREMLTLVKSRAPKAEEGIRWSMPALSYKRILVMFTAFKHHVGFYPTVAAMKPFLKDLEKFKTGKGSIQFPLDKPLPKTLIRKITARRVKQSIEQDGKWRP